MAFIARRHHTRGSKRIRTSDWFTSRRALSARARVAWAMALIQVAAILIITPSAHAATVFTSSTTLSGSHTWTTSGSPYVLKANVTVGNGATLTIQPGVVVKIASLKKLIVYGTLNASGSAGAPSSLRRSRTTQVREAMMVEMAQLLQPQGTIWDCSSSRRVHQARWTTSRCATGAMVARTRTTRPSMSGRPDPSRSTTRRSTTMNEPE